MGGGGVAKERRDPQSVRFTFGEGKGCSGTSGGSSRIWGMTTPHAGRGKALASS